MKKMVLAILIVFAVCVIPVLSAETGQDNGLAAARQSLAGAGVSENSVLTYNGMSETTRDSYYEFTDDAGNGYYVNARTRAVERVTNVFDWKKTLGGTVSAADAEKAAEKFLRQYSGKQERNGLEIVSSRLMDHGAFMEYVIDFREIKDGVFLPNAARVSIDPSDAGLLSYMSVNEDVTVSLQPALSEEEALKIAAGQFPGIRVVSADAFLEVTSPEKGNQRLVYTITLVGEPMDDMMYGGFLIVDANDGKVWYTSAFK